MDLRNLAISLVTTQAQRGYVAHSGSHSKVVMDPSLSTPQGKEAGS